MLLFVSGFVFFLVALALGYILDVPPYLWVSFVWAISPIWFVLFVVGKLLSKAYTKGQQEYKAAKLNLKLDR